jgi:hypothetical protein
MTEMILENRYPVGALDTQMSNVCCHVYEEGVWMKVSRVRVQPLMLIFLVGDEDFLLSAREFLLYHCRFFLFGIYFFAT